MRLGETLYQRAKEAGFTDLAVKGLSQALGRGTAAMGRGLGRTLGSSLRAARRAPGALKGVQTRLRPDGAWRSRVEQAAQELDSLARTAQAERAFSQAAKRVASSGRQAAGRVADAEARLFGSRPQLTPPGGPGSPATLLSPARWKSPPAPREITPLDRLTTPVSGARQTLANLAGQDAWQPLGISGIARALWSPRIPGLGRPVHLSQNPFRRVMNRPLDRTRQALGLAIEDVPRVLGAATLADVYSTYQRLPRQLSGQIGDALGWEPRSLAARRNDQRFLQEQRALGALGGGAAAVGDTLDVLPDPMLSEWYRYNAPPQIHSPLRTYWWLETEEQPAGPSHPMFDSIEEYLSNLGDRYGRTPRDELQHRLGGLGLAQRGGRFALEAMSDTPLGRVERDILSRLGAYQAAHRPADPPEVKAAPGIGAVGGSGALAAVEPDPPQLSWGETIRNTLSPLRWGLREGLSEGRHALLPEDTPSERLQALGELADRYIHPERAVTVTPQQQQAPEQSLLERTSIQPLEVLDPDLRGALAQFPASETAKLADELIELSLMEGGTKDELARRLRQRYEGGNLPPAERAIIAAVLLRLLTQ